MNSLTEASYGERKLGLVRAIELAEGEAHAAAFKTTTGSGSETEAKKAKGHLASLRDQLGDLESAWIGAQAARRAEVVEEREAEFNAYLVLVREQLDIRKRVVEAMPGVLAELGKQLNAYRDASEAIRAAGRPFFANVERGASFDRQSNVNNALTIDYAVHQLAFFSHKMAVPTVGHWESMFKDRTPVELEEGMASRIESAAKAFAPKTEAAA